MSKGFYAALILVVIIILLSLVGPYLSPYGYSDQQPDLRDLPPRVQILENIGIMDGSKVLLNRRLDSLDDKSVFPEGSVIGIVRKFETMGVAMADIKVNFYILNGASDKYFWLGTDYLGRDQWARLWTGARVSLFIALTAGGLNLLIGTLAGAAAGYYGGALDMVIMRIMEIAQGLPQIAVFTLIIMVFGAGPVQIILALGIRGWAGPARIIRAQFYKLKVREFVLSAQVMGASDLRVILRHIMPNAFGPVITRAASMVPGAIFAEAFLAYLGLGIQAPTPSIGVLLSDGQKYLLQSPYQVFFPALLISLLMVSFNVISIGLRERLDPARRYDNMFKKKRR